MKILPAILCAATAIGAVAVTAGEASAQPGYYGRHHAYRGYHGPRVYRHYGYGYRHHYRPSGYGYRHHRW